MTQFEIGGTTPILRMYDEVATKQFYTEHDPSGNLLRFYEEKES